MSAGAGKREAVFRRDRFRCMYCGEVFPREALTIDHVEPRMRGGDQSQGNLVTACRACNHEKADQPAWAYLAERHEKRQNFLRHARSVWPRLRRAIKEAAEAPGEGS